MSLREALKLARAAVASGARKTSAALDHLPVARTTLVLFLTSTVLGFSDSFAGPSYPSALLTGLIVPSVTALSCALLDASKTPSPEALLGLALRKALAHALAVMVPLCLQATRVGWCAPWHDLALFLLGPVLGLTLAAIWGAFVCLVSPYVLPLTKRKSVRIAAALLGPVGSMLAGLWGFYGSPAVFAFNPFVGFFAGALYDTGFDPTLRLLTYRTGTLGTLIAVAAVTRHLEYDATVKPKIRSRLDRPFAILGLLGLGLSVATTSAAISLGHASTASSIRAALGDNLRLGRCDLVFGARQNRLDMERLGRDCDAWLVRLERRLGTTPIEQVTVFVFDDPAQKERLMGAAHTQIAKPWRREIYLNAGPYPHDVLGHELGHLVGGQIAPGPFAIAGGLHGLLPNPGLIEGLAVALAPDEDADLTPMQWARTLLELGLLPPAKNLFSLGFFGHSGRIAYTVAGAFVDYVGRRYGKEAVASWYGGDSLEDVTKTRWTDLEQGFAEALKQTTLPPNAREAAAARFAQPGVLSRHCPHAVDRLLDEAEQRLSQGNGSGACGLFEQVNQLDPSELAARIGLGKCLEKGPRRPLAVQQFERIAADKTVPLASRQQAEERVADLLLLQGHRELARAIYQRLATATLEFDRRRTLALKAHAESPEAVQALTRLLFDEQGEQSWPVAVRELIRWSESEPTSGLPDYLLGRNFAHDRQLEIAAEHLDRALSKTIELPEIRAEALRQRALVACALGDKSRARTLADELAPNETMPMARRKGTLALVERCAGRPAQDDWPANPRAYVPEGIAASAPQGPQPWDSDHFSCPEGMVKIPGAIFWMGSERGKNSPDETPRFQTRVRGFCLDQTEVTVAAYRDCMDRGQCTKPSEIAVTCNAQHPDRDAHPINCVSFEQAESFCKQRDSRLPTELEWEYAARGGVRALKYPWGDAPPDGHACWKNYMTCPVKTYAPGAFDLYDISGNVWEWTSSDYGEYPFPPLPAEGNQKVYRGGSWSRRFEKWMHLGLRNRWATHKTGAHLGLRCAKTVPLACPFEQDAQGNCLPGVLAADCPVGQKWNGARCARPDSPECEEGMHVEPGHGCVRDIPLAIRAHTPDAALVKRQRSAQFDEDCRANQPLRPRAYRYFGGEHVDRNAAARRDGCKNRDVGDGWNSACCP